MKSRRGGIWRLIFLRRERGLGMIALQGLAQGIMTTRPDEIACLKLFESMDHYVEMQLAGMEAAGAMPLLRDHLNRCRDCQEEFLALLAAVKMTPVG
jgi:hypothetical protein